MESHSTLTRISPVLRDLTRASSGSAFSKLNVPVPSKAGLMSPVGRVRRVMREYVCGRCILGEISGEQ